MKTLSFILIVIACIFWGTSPLFVDYLAPLGFSSLQMTALRAAVSVIVMAIYILIKDKSLFKVKPLELLLFSLSGVAFLCTATFYFQSMQMTSSATAVVLMYTAPILVMVFSVLFFGERMTRLKFISIAAMLVGCCLVAGIVGGMRFDALGIFFGALSGISYAAYTIITKLSIRRGSNPIPATFYAFLAAFIILIFISKPREMVVRISADAWPMLPWVLLFGAVTCILPYFLYNLGMREISAGTASSLAIIEPMAVTVTSAIFLSQTPDVFTVVGIILILGAVFLLGILEGRE